MGDIYEVEVKATNSKNESVSHHFEYTSKEAADPDAAVREVVKGFTPSVGARLKTVSHAD